jgi:hypothetical protein
MADPPEVALSRIRAFCEEGIRYYTWALKRMPSLPDQAGHVPTIEQRRLGLAQILAFVEGSPDSRAAVVAARDDIVPRYVRMVEEENWTPTFADGVPPDLA